MAWMRRPDPERYRRRLEVLAERAGATSARIRVRPRERAERLREVIAARRRLAG